MSAYLPDLKTTTVTVAAFFPNGAVTVAATGPACDMIEGDGNVNALLHVGSGTGSTGPAGIVATVLGTAAGGTAGDAYTILGTFAFTGTTGGTGSQWITPFQRPGRYLKISLAPTGTAPSFVGVHASIVEQRKYLGVTVP